MASSRQGGKERSQSQQLSTSEFSLSVKPHPVRVNVSGTRYAVGEKVYQSTTSTMYLILSYLPMMRHDTVSLVAEQLEMEIVEDESDDW